MGVSNQVLLTLITIFTTVGKNISILCSIGIIARCRSNNITLQFRLNSDASLILAVLLLLWDLPMLRTVVSIIMQDCVTVMVVNASSA